MYVLKFITDMADISLIKAYYFSTEGTTAG